MPRADVYVWGAQTTAPRAALVICPGFNGDGEGFVRQEKWQEFARAGCVALCAVSFVSPEAEVQALHGYIHAERGSGALILQTVRLGFGRDLPILIYGFSCGGRLAISVADWRPARVLGWCGYSASWWEEPQFTARNFPPGIVACGEEDASNFGTSTTFFAKGRAAGLPWTWVSLGRTGHAWSQPLDDFVRVYFAALLRQPNGFAADANGIDAVGKQTGAGGWWDVDTKAELSGEQALQQPTLTSWLPARSLGVAWSNLHHP